jgi:TusA-related sulfurtransferase
MSQMTTTGQPIVPIVKENEMTSNEVQTLDVRGELCPYPMIKTNEELDEKQPGILALDVLTDHAPALSTIPPQALKRGYEVEIEEVRSGEWLVHLTKP